MPRPDRTPGRPTSDQDVPSVEDAARAIVRHVAGHRRGDASAGPATMAVVAGGSRRQRARVGELVARALDRDLHLLDLAAVVATYEGETSKHLDLVLRRAHQANTVLLFDEADAIFGTRTTVHDAHDRHANLAANHLLDRLGRFDGVIIVATREPPPRDDHRLRSFRPVIDLRTPRTSRDHEGTTLDEAEARVWSSLGVAPIEHRLHLATLGIDVRVQEVGPPDGRPAVFVHGAAVAGTSWANLAASLDGVRCLLLDRPGCGRSDPLPPPRDVGTFVEVSDRLVVDVLDALDVASAHVVGTSMGAHAAIRTAARHPDRVDRLLLFGWCLGSPGASAPLWIRANTLPGVGRLMNAVPLPRRVVVAMLRRFGMARAIDEHGLADSAIDVLVALYRDTDTLRNETVDAPALTSLRRGWDPRLVHDDTLLGQIAAPTCLVWGRDDPFGDADAALDLARRIPNARLHLLDRTGHAPWLDEPDRCTAIAQAFLRA